MTENTEILLQRFKAKKAEKDSTSLQEARRLVNLYRSLSCFGNDFVGKYNEMLLAIKPNVRRLLSTFMGGKEVEEYLEFLEQNAHLAVSETTQEGRGEVVPQNKGYLPMPDLDVGVNKTGEKMISVREEDWNKLCAQKEHLVKQTQDLLNVLKRFEGSSFASVQGIATPSEKSAFETYSEIIEESPGEK